VEFDVRVSPSPSFLPPVPPSPFEKALGIPFYRYKGMVQLYIWGCTYVLTRSAEKCLSPVWSVAGGAALGPADVSLPS
jgi:hypothetical protein